MAGIRHAADQVAEVIVLGALLPIRMAEAGIGAVLHRAINLAQGDLVLYGSEGNINVYLPGILPGGVTDVYYAAVIGDPPLARDIRAGRQVWLQQQGQWYLSNLRPRGELPGCYGVDSHFTFRLDRQV